MDKQGTRAWLAGAFDLLIDGLMAILLLILLVDTVAPPEDLPWKPLRLDQPLGVASRYKLDRVVTSPQQCLAFLNTNGVPFSSAPSPERSGPCQAATPVRLKNAFLTPRAPLMTCPLASAYVLWSEAAVQPAAERLFNSPVRAVEQVGTYACRGVRNITTASVKADPSEHAHANAIDITGFRLADGAEIRVARDWTGVRPKARFLRDVRSGACRVFHTTLSPDYNPAHASHLHLDMGRYRLCS